MKNRMAFANGLAAGFPIGLGYFAVAFSLGILARKAGLTAFQGFWASFFNVASAGEYALFTAMENGASFFGVALITFVVNGRYLLMSCALSQKMSPEMPFFHRFLVGFGVTDEIFAVSVSRAYPLNPWFNYGAMAISIPLWSLGTSLGIVAGNILPPSVVNALSVALYGMFIAIIIPPARKDKVIAGAVLVSFALSWLFSIAPIIKNLSSGNRTIILTVVISAILAILKPVKDEEEGESNNE